MKKYVAILLGMVLLSVCACQKKPPQPPVPEKDFAYPIKVDMVTEGQYYKSSEVQFPASLWQKPVAEEVPALNQDGVKAYFLDSVKGTKVFAYVGIPMTATKQSPVPAMVLVHGGGGTAFLDWIDIWNRRGYAAIAMDTDGHMPTATSNMNNNDHAISSKPHGPENGAFTDAAKPIEEQWAYHALASVIVSNSFIRSFEEVDGTKIGLTGISYGGFLSSVIPGYDDRFAFSAPVYGSISEKGTEGHFGTYFKNYPRAAELWDNVALLEESRTPIFFINGSNDSFFTVDATSRCVTASMYGSMLLKFKFQHGHTLGADIPEIFTFADNICKGEKGLIRVITQPTKEDGELSIQIPTACELRNVLMYYTKDIHLNDLTSWKVERVDFDKNAIKAGKNIIDFVLPKDTKSFYFEIIDGREMSVSTIVVSI